MNPAPKPKRCNPLRECGREARFIYGRANGASSSVPLADEVIRLVVDVTLSFRAYELIRNLGIEIVYEAGVGEPDEVWFAAGLVHLPHAVVSADTGVGLRCVESKVRWIRLPNNIGGRLQAVLVVKTLRRWRWLPPGTVVRGER